MAINQIGYFGQSADARIANFIQNPGQLGIGNVLGTFGQGNIAQTYGGIFILPLAPGQTILIPAGQWITQAGPYSDLQYFDGSSQVWRNLAMAADVAPIPISSDGTNVRFANTTGCPIGAVVTTTGTAGSLPVSVYTSTGVWTGGGFTAQATPAVTATPSAGGSLWNTFIGGAISQTVTITAGGTNYTLAPKIVVVPPAAQGQQPFMPATAVCTISGGAINAVTVTNQGAGFVAAPTLLIVNQAGDVTGSGGILTATLTGTGQVTGVVQSGVGISYGTPLTATPTLTMGGASLPASAAATVLMNYSLTATGAGTVTAGSGYTNGYVILAGGGMSTATPVYVNPFFEKGIAMPSQPVISSASTTAVGLNNAASLNTFFGSGFTATTGLVLQPLAGVGSGGAIVGPTVGGQNDICTLYPI